MTVRPRRRWLPGAAVLLLGLGLAWGAAELALRLAGRTPFAPHLRPLNEPALFEPEPVLGWRSRTGSLDFPGYRPGAAPIRWTVRPDGARHTGPGPDAPAPLVALVGGSFVQGWAVSDEDTFAWDLQQRWPDVRVRNHGTGGYGTLQSLLRAEQLFAGPTPPDVVLYGLIQLHEGRNVATADWLYTLAATSSRGTAGTPYATLRDGRLVRHAAISYPRWPGSRAFASVAFLQDLVVRARARARSQQGLQVTLELMGEMRALCRRHDAGFAVLLLWLDDVRQQFYRRALEHADIEAVDCVFPLPPERRVPGDGHPNAAQHRLWAQCIDRALAGRITRNGLAPAPETDAR